MSYEIAIPFDAFEIRIRAKALGARWKAATKTWAMPDKASMDKVATWLAVGIGQDSIAPDMGLVQLRDELARTQMELGSTRKANHDLVAQVAKLQAGQAGHDLTEAHVQAVAEAAGRATVDAVIKALGQLRVKPDPKAEAQRIARMTPLPDGAPTPKARILDTDDAPAPVRATTIAPDALAAMRARLKGDGSNDAQISRAYGLTIKAPARKLREMRWMSV